MLTPGNIELPTGPRQIDRRKVYAKRSYLPEIDEKTN